MMFYLALIYHALARFCVSFGVANLALALIEYAQAAIKLVAINSKINVAEFSVTRATSLGNLPSSHPSRPAPVLRLCALPLR